MKKIFFSTCLFTFAITGCSTEENIVIKTKNFYISNCKNDNHVSNSITSFSDLTSQESIIYSAKDKYFKITHTNLIMNCCGDLKLSVSKEDSIITVTENEINPTCNCVCPFDVSYEVGPLKGGTYWIAIRFLSEEIAKFKIYFNKSTSGIFSIEK